MTETPNLDAAKAAAAVGSPVPDMRKRRAKASKDSGEVREPDLFVHLPPDCPVTALGVQGKELWLLEGLCQIYSLKPRELDKGQLMLMFGGEAYLVKQWPETKVVPGTGKKHERPEFYETGDFNQNDVQKAIINACFAQGMFKPTGKVFGRGAHRGRDEQSEMVLHLGDRVLVSSAKDWRGAKAQVTVSEHAPGKMGKRIYPADDALPPPAMEPSSIEEAEELLTLIGRWQFADGAGARILLLGMIGQMFFCGVLDWRAHGWIKAATGAGKSTLLSLILAILGGRDTGWALYSNDATEAGIRQLLGGDTLPVILDEAEAADGPERQRAILNLIKKSSSEGGNIVRGGADHQASQFKAQSCFMCASVLHAPMLGEDRNRIVIFDLLTLAKHAPPLELRPKLPHWFQVGRKMHRRMLEQWPRFDDTWQIYKAEIAKHGFAARWQDTYGTLLACADLLLNDEAPSHANMANDNYGREKALVASILPMMALGMTESRTDDERITLYLQNLIIPGANGAAAETIGQWLVRAMDWDPNSEGYDQPATREVARKRLKTYGLRVVTLKDKIDPATGRTTDKRTIGDEPAPDSWDTSYLAIAGASCRPLCDLFIQSKEWSNGGWMQSLSKIEGAEKSLKVRFTGKNPDNAIAIPLSALKGEE
jgi:hypothetical protein